MNSKYIIEECRNLLSTRFRAISRDFILKRGSEYAIIYYLPNLNIKKIREISADEKS